MQDWSTKPWGSSTKAVMIAWAQVEFGNTPWPVPGKRRATELCSPGVISPTQLGAVLESNAPDRIRVGTALDTGRRSAVSERPSPQASHSRKIQLPVGVIRRTESGRPGIAVRAWDRASSGVVQFAISWQ